MYKYSGRRPHVEPTVARWATDVAKGPLIPCADPVRYDTASWAWFCKNDWQNESLWAIIGFVPYPQSTA